ncbi:MAG TPA: hypothetical protein VI731_00565 [Bacteroidia bacterium]|nr:hypothetical protein [Bacteroidia bacterium]
MRSNYNLYFLIIVFIFLSSHCIKSQEAPQLKNQILVGASFFPLWYVDITDDFEPNLVLYGYHLTYVRKLKNLQARIGAMGGYFRSDFLSIGVEIGLEQLIHSKNGKWNFRYGPCLFLAKWRQGPTNKASTLYLSSIAGGITGAFERVLSQRFHLFTEINLSLEYWSQKWYGRFHQAHWIVKSYRFLGIGVGYSF